MKLYDGAGAPSPRRVRIFLAEKGIEIPRVAVDLRSGEHLRDEYLRINPRGVVPALELDDGTVLTESSAICRYLEALHPTPPLFGSDPAEIGHIEQWTRKVEGEGYTATVYTLRNSASAFEGRGEAGKWPPIPQIPDLVERGRTMWGAFTAALDRRLADREWIAGDRFSYADITALVTVDFAARAKLPLPETCSNVHRWHAAASARPGAVA